MNVADIPLGDCCELAMVVRGDKDGGSIGGSWWSKLLFWYSWGRGRARSGGGSIGVRGPKYEDVLPDEADDLLVDSEVSRGGGWLCPVRCACCMDPVRFSLSEGSP